MNTDNQSNLTTANAKPKIILDEVLNTQKEIDLQEFEPVRFVNDLLVDVDNRAKNIILKRFGIDGGRPKTLESLGKNYSITRERVRQIESLTIKELKQGHKSKNINQASKVIHATLSEAGGVMEQEALLDTLLGEDKNSEADRAAMLFLLILSDEVKKHTENDRFKTIWASNEAAYDKLVDLVKTIEEIFNKNAKALKLEKIREAVNCDNKNNVNENEIKAAVATSKVVGVNPFGEYGLVGWNEIVPKGVRDKAYLVVRQQGSPLHFMKITEKINSIKFDHREAYPQTVHNELIKDKRFVLVGRGIYALREWGYNPGTVSDVLQTILKEAGGPMDRATLLKEVMKRRIVKRNTVLIGLQDKNIFTRVDGQRYDLVKR